MIINGKEMSAKQFAQEYVPTPEEFSIHTKVELYYKLEDIKTILDEYFDGATIDDLGDDEINAIMDIYDEYLEERGYDYSEMIKIIRQVAEDITSRHAERAIVNIAITCFENEKKGLLSRKHLGTSFFNEYDLPFKFVQAYGWTSEEITAVAVKHKIEIFDDTSGIFGNVNEKYLIITSAIVEELKNYIK